MNRIAVVGLIAAMGIGGGCNGQDRAEGPGESGAFPAAETPTPQTSAPGVEPGTEPIPRTAPGVIQPDTLEHAGAPGADARPGV